MSGPSDARAFDVRTAPLPLFSLLARDAETCGYAVDISDGRIVVGAPETDEGRGTFESVGTIIDAATLSGLWYDPTQEGEAFNVISGQPGTLVYYYGNTNNGERIWLVSDLLSNDFSDSTTLNGRLYGAMGGDFYHPAPSATALRNWGMLEARFDDCDDGRFTLIGSDGSKSSIVVKLAGVVGAECR